MKNTIKNNMPRRDFLKFSAIAALALSLPNTAEAEGFSDYKALVHVYLPGGNDSINMIIPTKSGDIEDGTTHEHYAKMRDTLTVANVDIDLSLNILSNGYLDLSLNPYDPNTEMDEAKSYVMGMYKTADGFGFNAVMPELAHLYSLGKVAVIANIGNLIEPTTRETFYNAELPPYLHAHNHQGRAIMSCHPQDLTAYGWGGRMREIMGDVNSGHILGDYMSYGSGNFAESATVPAIKMQRGEPVVYTPTYNDEVDAADRTLLENMAADEGEEFQNFRRLFRAQIGKSLTLTDSLVEAWEYGGAALSGLTNAYGKPLFEPLDKDTLSMSRAPYARLQGQLASVARMIAYSKSKGLKRQVFYVEHDNCDYHRYQLTAHPIYLREISYAIDEFYIAMRHLGVEDSVTAMITSEFGRTSSSNGDGTDHAWGGHLFAVGGAVNGGLYGNMPDLKIGSVDDKPDSSNRGVLIPQFGMEQYEGAIARWFGATDDQLDYIFPNLKNFKEIDGTFDLIPMMQA